ncbi:hypothetical protein [Collimonas arenae]|uniref:hypothetical protein n=1 Tax=Collimonas arenae TaxID=279058 RepID=UPI000B0F674D
MSSATIRPPARPPTLTWKKVKRIGPLGTILLLHVAFFWALENGLIHQAAQALPKEIIASFITPEKAPEPTPPKPQPAPPKTVAVVKKSITPPRPTPVVNNTPSETAISVPTPPPQPPQREEPVAVAAPPRHRLPLRRSRAPSPPASSTSSRLM